jgi:hypothetical protein
LQSPIAPIANRANRAIAHRANRQSQRRFFSTIMCVDTILDAGLSSYYYLFALVTKCYKAQAVEKLDCCRETYAVTAFFAYSLCRANLLKNNCSKTIAQKQLPQNKAKEGHSCNAFAACCWLSKH